MWSINIDWHIARGQFVLNTRAHRSKTNQRNLVGGFGQDVKEIVFVRL
jgi:hypothetical protein